MFTLLGVHGGLMVFESRFTSSLLAEGFILFIITFLVLAAARLMLARLEVKA